MYEFDANALAILEKQKLDEFWANSVKLGFTEETT